MEALDVDETLAQLLVAEGFSELEEVAYVEPDELAAIEGFDEDLVGELQRRAQDALEAKAAEADEKRKSLGVEDKLAEIEELTPFMLVALGEAGVKTLEDFAGFTPDELISDHDAPLRGHDLGAEDAEAMIMQARRMAGWIGEEDLPPPTEAAPSGEESVGETAAAGAEGSDAGGQ